MRHRNVLTVWSTICSAASCTLASFKGENSCEEKSLAEITDEEGNDLFESDAEEDEEESESQSSKDFRTAHNYSDSKSYPLPDLTLHTNINFC